MCGFSMHHGFWVSRERASVGRGELSSRTNWARAAVSSNPVSRVTQCSFCHILLVTRQWLTLAQIQTRELSSHSQRGGGRSHFRGADGTGAMIAATFGKGSLSRRRLAVNGSKNDKFTFVLAEFEVPIEFWR